MPHKNKLPDEIQELTKWQAYSTKDGFEKLVKEINRYKRVYFTQQSPAEMPTVFANEHMYLSGIDTTRSRKDELIGGFRQEVRYRNINAKMEIFMALTQGQGVVVTNHHVIDSTDFLLTMNDIIKANKEVKAPNLPFKFSRFKYDSWGDDPPIYDVVANTIALDGYRLSGWEELDKDQERRGRWAEAIRKQEGGRDAVLKDCTHSEERQVNALFNVMAFFHQYYERKDKRYFSDSTNASHVFRADMEELNALASLDTEQLYTLLPGTISDPAMLSATQRMLERISQTLNKYQNGFVSRSPYYTDILVDQEDPFFVMGIRELIDSIYNNTVSVSCEAQTFHNSFVRNMVDNPYVKVGQELSPWIRKMSIKNNNFELFTPDDWIIDDYLAFTGVNDRSIRAINDFFSWESLLFAIHQSPMRAHLIEMRAALTQWRAYKQIAELDPAGQSQFREKQKNQLLIYGEALSNQLTALGAYFKHIKSRLDDTGIKIFDGEELILNYEIGEIRTTAEQDRHQNTQDVDKNIEGFTGEVIGHD